MKKLSKLEEFQRDWQNIALKEHVDACKWLGVERTTNRVVAAFVWSHMVMEMNMLFPGHTRRFDLDKIEGALLRQNWVKRQGTLLYLTWPKKKLREFLKKNAKRYLAKKKSSD